MEDTIRACRALWSEAPTSFVSPTVSFEDLWCLPHPVQPGGIPIWFGVGLSQRNIARIVEFGAGWMPVGASQDELVSGARSLREACEAAGRDPSTIGVRGSVAPVRGADKRPDLARSLQAALPLLHEAGATTASLALAAFVRRAEDIRPFLEELGTLRNT